LELYELDDRVILCCPTEGEKIDFAKVTTKENGKNGKNGIPPYGWRIENLLPS
jgi:hypothetical protein